MFISISILFLFLVSVKVLSSDKNKFTLTDFFLFVFLSFSFSTTYFISIYIDLQGGYSSYFPGIFKNDSLRYLEETKMFIENPFKVDELKGTFFDYDVTPKIGLPSLLASLNFLSIENHYFIYTEFIFISFILCIINFLLLKKLAVLLGFENKKLYILSFFIFVCFPFEFYWKTRLLREVIVHSLFLGALLLLVLSCYSNKKYYSVFIIYSLLILLFRAQIYFLVFFFSLVLFKSLSKRELIILILILLMAFFQSVLASGISFYRGFLETQEILYLRTLYTFLESKISFLYCTVLFSSILFTKAKKIINPIFPSPYSFLYFSVPTVVFIIVKMNSIRFFYPVMLFSLALIFFFYAIKKKVDCK